MPSTSTGTGSGGPDRREAEAIPLIARIAGLSQTAEVFMAADGPAAAREVVRTRRGAWFDPRIADVFLSLTPDDAIWARLRADDVFDLLRDLEPPEGIAFADEQQLDRVAEAFAGVIDAMSPYTARHSVGVAHHAVGIGQKMGFDAADLRSLRRAGRLNDIATTSESSASRTASSTSRTSSPTSSSPRSVGIRSTRSRSSRGSPRSRSSPRMARILAVADVYEALTATRPYRGPLTHEAALDVLWRGAGTAFDPDYIAALEEASKEHVRQIER